MKDKVYDNQNKKRYAQKICGASFEAYVNKDGGWIDHLLSDKILLSHRTNHYSQNALPEKLHAHHYYELTLIANGDSVTYIADGQSVQLHRGMAVLTKPMRFHMFRPDAPIDYDRYVLYFRDVEAIFPDTAIMNFTKMGNASCAVFDLPEQSLLSYLKSAEDALADIASPYSSAGAYLNICNIFLTLSNNKATIEEKLPTPTPHFISQIKKYIDENHLHIHSVEEIARQFFYSREYISRSFRKYYNTPLYEYILRRKMQHSLLLMKNGASVEESARTSGFGNMSSYIKLFRKVYGCTPSEYKDKQR